MHKLTKQDNLEDILKNSEAVLLYFSHDECNVCKALKPKIKEEFKINFPKTKLIYIDIKEFPEIASKNNVFSVPTILIFLDSKESFRFGRNSSLELIKEKFSRLYNMFFD